MKKLATILLALCSCIGISEGIAFGDILIDGGPNSELQEFLGGNYAAGSEFTSNTTFIVNALGWLDAEGDGLVDSHRVGLWDTSDMSLLAETLVTPGSTIEASAQGTAQWFLESIGGNLTLGPGTYRVAGIVGTVGDNFTLSNDKIGNGVTISDGYVRTEFPDGGFAYPDLTFGSQAVRATVGVTQIPEPSSVSILLTLAVCAFVRRGRK
jgi:hypothetical protein